ncbi:MAG: hypothetical protein HKO53_01105, partial [Gemmatimonadetes bacterium]|nr:hypothetical protein [Gemmatimonadota bacterium]
MLLPGVTVRPFIIPEPRSRPSKAARYAVWAAVVLVLSQAGSLVYRAHAGTSDVSVFIRTAEVVREGGAGP